MRPPSGSASLLPLRVSDIKQYLYCPRIIYYQYVLPVPRRVTYKMKTGLEEHFELDRLEKRRRLVEYGLDKGERRFHVRLSSERLALEGILDLLVVTPEGHFPVEFKYTSGGPAINHKYQLVAYAMLTEEAFGEPVRTGFLYLAPSKMIQPVEMTASSKTHTVRLLGAIRRLVAEGSVPDRTRTAGRCRDCEFRNYCADHDRASKPQVAGMPVRNVSLRMSGDGLAPDRSGMGGE